MGEVRRAFVACGFTIGICVTAALVANWSHISMNPAARSRASSKADLSTGSMLIVSPGGSLCRQRTIDNDDWQIRETDGSIARTRWPSPRNREPTADRRARGSISFARVSWADPSGSAEFPSPLPAGRGR